MLFVERSATGLALRRSSPISLGRRKLGFDVSARAVVDAEVTRLACVPDLIDAPELSTLGAAFLACLSSFETLGLFSREAVTGLGALGCFAEANMEVMFVDLATAFVVIGRRIAVAFEFGRESALW